MLKPAQLVLDLPHRVALGREDFLVSPANAAAVAMIDQWPNWPSHAILLVGPHGSGKSHLVEVWRQMSAAPLVAAADLQVDTVPQLLRTGNLAIEDASAALDERALFHLLNLAKEQGARVLITAQNLPAQWGLRVPDLLSRLRAAPVVTLGVADDALLRGVLAKLFADRQLAVDEPVLSYMVVRMPRSLAAAGQLVAEIDRRALAEKADVSRAFVARILGDIAEPDLFVD